MNTFNVKYTYHLLEQEFIDHAECDEWYKICIRLVPYKIRKKKALENEGHNICNEKMSSLVTDQRVSSY